MISLAINGTRALRLYHAARARRRCCRRTPNSLLALMNVFLPVRVGNLAFPNAIYTFR